jgi:hypothetical protein
MSEQNKKYESVLVGWADEPSYNENGELMGWSFRLKDNELKDCIDQYTTKRDASGQGGNVRFRLFMSKSGKACLSVWDPNSEAAQRLRRRILRLSRSSIVELFRLVGGCGLRLHPLSFPLSLRDDQEEKPN